MINLKFGDVVRIHPEIANPDVVVAAENMSRSKKKPYPVCGIYYKTLENGSVMLVDCFFWNGNIYEDGVAIISKDKLGDLDFSNAGMISKYFQARKAYKGNLVYERESKYSGLTAEEELKERAEEKAHKQQVVDELKATIEMAIDDVMGMWPDPNDKGLKL